MAVGGDGSRYLLRVRRVVVGGEHGWGGDGCTVRSRDGLSPRFFWKNGSVDGRISVRPVRVFMVRQKV